VVCVVFCCDTAIGIHMSVETVQADTGYSWYAISVLSRHEKTVAQQIVDAAKRAKMPEKIKRIVVPSETVIEVRRGQKIPRERIFMPGYLLIQMEMTDESYHLVKGISRVSGFLGTAGNADPMPESDVNVILNRTETGRIAPRALISFEVGDSVAVTDGPFEGWNGNVEEVDSENRRVVIGVSIFGRLTQTDLSFDQVTKES